MTMNQIFAKRVTIEKSGENRKQSENEIIKPVEENSEYAVMKLLSRSVDDLSDEELTEILIRLPVDCIHRIRCVCKRWLALTSESSFANFYIRLHNNINNSQQFKHHGFFLLYRCSNTLQHINLSTGGDDQLLSIPPRFFNFSLSFLPAVRNRTYLELLRVSDGRVHHNVRCQSEKLKYLELLRVSEGLVLCEGRFYSDDSIFSSESQVFYICNPLTKQCIELPPSPWPISHWADRHKAVGFMCSGATFTVTRIADDHNKYDIHVFSSNMDGSAGSGKWQTFCVLGSNSPRFKLLQINEVVVCNGKFHWNGETSIVVYDPLCDPSRCDSIPLPVDITNSMHYKGRSVAVSEGCIRLYDLGKNRDSNSGYEIWIWDLLDYGRCEWSSKYKVVVESGYRFAFFSEINRHTFYVISFYDYRSCIKISHLPMDGEGCLNEWDLGRYRYYPDRIKLLPFVINLWPTSPTTTKTYSHE